MRLLLPVGVKCSAETRCTALGDVNLPSGYWIHPHTLNLEAAFEYVRDHVGLEVPGNATAASMMATADMSHWRLQWRELLAQLLHNRRLNAAPGSGDGGPRVTTASLLGLRNDTLLFECPAPASCVVREGLILDCAEGHTG